MQASATATATTTLKSTTENLYMQLNESELTAIIMKGSPNSNDRDAGFCSGSSEGGDDLSIDHTRLEPSSSIDGSDDSVEVKITPISLVRNKRKSSEPSKVICEKKTAINAISSSSTTTGPLKKRIRYTSSADSAVALTPSSVATATPPPLPMHHHTTPIWDPSQVLPHELMPNPAQIFVRHPGVTTLHRMPITDTEQQEPLALVAKKRKANEDSTATGSINDVECLTNKKHNDSDSNNNNNLAATLPTIITTTTSSPKAKKLALKKVAKISEDRAKLKANSIQPPLETITAPPSVASSTEEEFGGSVLRPDIPSTSSIGNRPQQRNYKNMTRERRIEANARERTRVHTISAAYETLRHAVPSYSTAQKLSKLSVLRVACSYILTLSRMAGHDYSIDESEPSVDSCFDALTSTILTEGKIKKKKDE